MTACPHGRVNHKAATIVDGPSGRRLRCYCFDCECFVETVPRINKRTQAVEPGQWVTVEHTIVEHEFDLK